MLDLIDLDILQDALIRKQKIEPDDVMAVPLPSSGAIDISSQLLEEHINDDSPKNDFRSADFELGQTPQILAQTFQSDISFTLDNVLSSDHPWMLSLDVQATNGDHIQAPEYLAYELNKAYGFPAARESDQEVYSLNIPSPLVDDL